MDPSEHEHTFASEPVADDDSSGRLESPQTRKSAEERVGSQNQEEQQDAVRGVFERSQSGAPAVGSVVRDRFSADEVFQRIVAVADEEVTSRSRELLFSGIAAGFAITITFLLYASLYGSTDGHPVLSALLYPLGFIYIILGGYQLYTENTLPPVALSLERLASLPALLRHWTIVITGNFTGATIGAAVLAWGGVFSDDAADAAMYLGTHGVETAWSDLFFKATFAGLIVAGVVWVVYASGDTISRLVVVYLAFLAIPIGNLFHVVTSFTEMSYTVFAGDLSFFVGLTQFVLPVLLGNTIGGVLLVTVVNYFQTSEERLESARFKGIKRRLSIKEWLFGGLVGRSYVPLIDTAERIEEAGREDAYRVIVPIANPRTESRLINLAAKLTEHRESVIIQVVHVVQIPGQSATTRQRDQIVSESEALLRDISPDVNEYNIEFEYSTIVTHRSFEEIFNLAESKHSNLVVIGWGVNEFWGAARAERPLSELTQQLPCDFVVLRDRGFDPSRILLPTAGGPDSDLSAEIARTFQSAADAEVTLLHVVDDPDERQAGEQFLLDWAADHGLQDTDLIVDDSGDVEGAIYRESQESTLLLLGATERGLLSRLVTGSLHFNVVNEVNCSVILAERPTNRSLLKRLFN